MAKANLLIDPQTQLTPRQRNLLFAIIKEFCDHGESIGSKELQEKYGFDFSPATIRNELAKLRELGYLFQPFTNSSNQPSEKAFKLFINQLLTGLQVTNRQQQDLKKQLMEMEHKQLSLNKEISRLLAFETGGVAFSLSKGNDSVSGISNLLKTPGDGKVSDILDFLDNIDLYKPLLLEDSSQNNQPDSKTPNASKLRTIIGTDNPIIPLGKGYAMVTTEIFSEETGEKSVVGVITPVHLLAKKKNLQLVEALSKLLNGEHTNN